MPSLQTNTLDQTFAYDGVDRLIWANIGGSPTYGYEYDATGNRTLFNLNGTPYTHTVSPSSNKLTSVQIAGEGNTPLTQAISYDPAGNTTQTTSGSPSTSPLSLSYSARGRLSAAQIPNPQNINTPYTVNYLTNGLEQRVYKSGPTALIPTGSTSYFYDEAGHLLGEYDANLVPVYETVYLNESPVAIIKQNRTPNPNTQPQTYTVTTEIFNVYSDHIDTPRVITRATDQSIVWSWMAAEPFGATQPNQNPHNLGPFTFNQRFPGHVFDVETNLNQNWNREYQGLSGRYTQVDPLGLKGGDLSLYSYVGANPLGAIDPTGLINATTFPTDGGGGSKAVGSPGGGGGTGIGITGLGLGLGMTAAINAYTDKAKNEECEKCDPPKGTVCFFIDRVPPSKPHYPIEGSHNHLYQMNQTPEGKCFWNKIGASPTAPPGAVACPFPRPKTR